MNELFTNAVIAALRSMGFPVDRTGVSSIKVGKVPFSWWHTSRHVRFHGRRYELQGRGKSRTLDVNQAVLDIIKDMPVRLAELAREDKANLHKEQAKAMQPRPCCSFYGDDKGIHLVITADHPVDLNAMLDLLQESGLLPTA